MSLYIGKSDTYGGGILHITNTATSKEVLKNTIVDSTVFHSSLPYLNLISSTSVSINTTTAYAGYSISGVGAAYVGLITATIPSTLFQYFNNDYLVVVECKSRNSNNVSTFTNFPAISLYNNSYYNSYSYYSESSRTFTDSPNVPIGGGYYNNPYANVLAIKTSFTASSSYPYLVLSFNKSGTSLFDSIFLQSYGGINQIDEVNPLGTVHVFKLSKNSLNPGYNNNMSVLLNKNEFIINSDTGIVDMENHSFVKYSSLNGNIKYTLPYTNTPISGFDIFNKDKIPAIGWDINFGTANPYINKITQSNGIIPTFNSSTKYLKLVDTVSVPISISHSGDYPSTILSSYSGNYSLGIVFIWVTCIMNGITVSIPSHYQLIFSGNYGDYTLSSCSVSVTNNQGGKTSRVAKFTTSNSSNSISIAYNSYLSGNIYPISANVTGGISLLIFN